MTELQRLALRRAVLALILVSGGFWLGSNPQRLWQVLQGWCVEVQPDGREEMVYGAACQIRQIRARHPVEDNLP
ncbi:MAG: hypothetical protein HC838_13295 [Spirulinaceae cyanobacterium RM2_2_10]|nr:hypothetical protein [Spirulinaceae cyanobacterium SM2_1_0]NJO20815.1 hypothetical protein [Spirulinaceae cyanobacterium RM2_2_10]